MRMETWASVMVRNWKIRVEADSFGEARHTNFILP